MSFPTAGVKVWILAFEMPGIRGCSETALDTMVVTSGSKPAAADMAKLVEPWQWTTAFTVVGAGLGGDGADQGRVVVDGRFIERPRARREVDAGAPVLEPDIPSVVDEHVDQRRLSRRPEDVGAHAGAVHEHDRTARRRSLTGHMVKVEHRAIVSGHRNDVGAVSSSRFLQILASCRDRGRCATTRS